CARVATPTSAAVAAVAVVLLTACGAARRSPRSATATDAACTSAYVDWLSRSDGATCDAAKNVASAIFMGDDGDVRSSFMPEDFSPLPTVKVAGVGYLPTRVAGFWRCTYETRRSSYG